MPTRRRRVSSPASAGNTLRHRPPARLRRLLGSLVILSYFCGGFGTATGAVADLLRAQIPGGARSACGCDESASCCGAACCEPAAAVPDCCGPLAAAAPSSCCASDDVLDEPAVVATALVAGCTCGARSHQPATSHGLDVHVPEPSGDRLGVLPPTSHDHAGPPVVALWLPEPRDHVPRPPLPRT